MRGNIARSTPLAKPRLGINSSFAMISPLARVSFNTTQTARIGWFFGQKLLAARMGRPVRLPEGLRGRPMPDRQRLLADLRSLLEQDWRNIEAGYYAPPAEGLGNPLEEIRRVLDFFADLSTVERRRHGGREERLLLAFGGGAFDEGGGIPLAEENLQALQFQPALEQVNLRRFTGTIQPFNGNQASREIQFGKGLHHGPATKLAPAPTMTRFSTR